MAILREAIERWNGSLERRSAARASAVESKSRPIVRSDIEMMFRLFLHREPEAESVIDEFLKLESLEQLCKVFLESDEYRIKFTRHQTSLEWPPISVNVDAQAALQKALLDHVERTWRELGKADPYWSVISRPEFHKDTYEENATVFRESGRMDVARLQAFAARSGVRLDAFSRCLELGCGVGRITQWLAKVFPQVSAADISSEHLAIIRRDLNIPNVDTVLLSSLDDLQRLPEYDVFFSILVLQHNPPPIIASMLRDILWKLKPGGIAYFQLPTYSTNYQFDATSYLEQLPTSGAMEMHVIPQAAVFEIASACDCVVLEVREDACTGDIGGISNTFFLRKRHLDLLQPQTQP